MGNTRELFKKIRDTRGTFHAKMGTIKDTNSIDLIEAEDIKKRVILLIPGTQGFPGGSGGKDTAFIVDSIPG